MSIESSIKWLSKRLKNEYDIKAMNEIIDFVNNQQKLTVNDHLLFAKLFIHKLNDIKLHDKDFLVNKFNQRAMTDILKIDIEEYYKEFTFTLNENHLRYVFEENGIETKHPFLKEDEELDLDKLKLSNMTKKDIDSIINGFWDEEDVKTRLIDMINTALLKYQV